MIPSTFVTLANARRRRRGDAGPRQPFADVRSAVAMLAEGGIEVDQLTTDRLGELARLAETASELADCLVLRRPPTRRAVDVLNELASASIGTRQLGVSEGQLESHVDWRDPDAIAALSRRVVEELGQLDTRRLLACEREECGLVFFDPTRSRTQRWHAENPCGWLARQQRRRAGATTAVGRTGPGSSGPG